VESVVAICPGGVGRQKIGIVLKASALRMCGAWGARKLRESILGRAPAELPPAIQAFMNFVSLIHENFRPRMVRMPISSDRALKRLTMPVMAILGGKDALLDSAGTKRRLERNVARAEIRYLPEGGHLLPGQTMPILDFLRREAGRPETPETCPTLRRREQNARGVEALLDPAVQFAADQVLPGG
jgi:pimeloyl-ACP methyl ester carboxylesterase